MKAFRAATRTTDLLQQLRDLDINDDDKEDEDDDIDNGDTRKQ